MLTGRRVYYGWCLEYDGIVQFSLSEFCLEDLKPGKVRSMKSRVYFNREHEKKIETCITFLSLPFSLTHPFCLTPTTPPQAKTTQHLAFLLCSTPPSWTNPTNIATHTHSAHQKPSQHPGTHPNCLEGRRLVVHFSMALILTSKRGEMTPHLMSRPVRLTTILPARWSSTISNSPM